MRIPHNALRSTLIVREFLGNGSMGPVLGNPRELKASVQATNKLLITDVGEEQTADLMVLIRPEDGPIKVESKIEWQDVSYRVVQSFPMPDDFRPTHWELMLRKWSS